MSLSSTQADIEAALKASGRFSQVGIWAGDIQGLIDAPKSVPAAFVILSGVNYDLPIGLRPTTAISDNLWSIIVFEYASKAVGQEIAAYQAIEAVVAAIINLKVGANQRLWPAHARLLGAVKNSVCGYGIQFSLI
jgi:hypothetical protein